MSATPTDVNVRVVADGDPGRIRYRSTLRQILPLAAVFGCLSLSWVLEWVIFPPDPRGGAGVTGWLMSFPVVMSVVFAGEIWLLGRWVGVTLTAEAAIVHSLRRRTIAWDRIAAIQVQRFMGSRRIVLYETSGRRTPLRMPVTGFMSRDPRFEEKAAVIQQWWITRRGLTPDGTPPALWAGHPRAPLPDRLRLRIAANQWLLPMTVVILWAAGAAVSSSFPDDAPDGSTSGLLTVAVAVAVALAVAGYLYARRGIDLTSGSVRVRGLRTRTIRWADISSIGVEAWRGGRRVVIHDTDGHRITLPAPRTGLLLWDSGFQVKADTLERWWRHHRGDDWIPATATAATRQPAAPYTGPRAWQRVLVGLIWLALGYQVLVVALIGLLFAAS